jgi:hypothetical protein
MASFLGDGECDLGLSSSVEVSRYVITVSRDPVQAEVLVGEPVECGGEATEVSIADMLNLERI